MVIKRLHQYGFILLLLLVSHTSLSASQLILFTDKSESIIGRPIRADLYGISLGSKISEINLSKLNENFGIVTDYVISETSDKRWPNQEIQILRLKLYPRNTGKIIIPPLSSNNVYSKEKILNITGENTALPKITISTLKPYERQQIIIQVSSVSDDPTSRLSISENTDISGFESHALEFKRTKNKDGKYLLQIGFALSALKSGMVKFELPAIEYSISGVSRKQFYFPIQKLTIKPLPSYLPPTIPVGKVDIESKLSTTLFKTNSIYYWNIQLSGELSNSYQLPAILRQIKSNKNIKYFPANSKRSAIKQANNLTNIVTHSIPFKSLNSGALDLPVIQFQYFDPTTGKIKKIIHHQNKAFSLNLFWRSIVSIIATAILIYLFKHIYQKWMKFKSSKDKRTQALQLLKINNIEQLREAIRLQAESESWPKNITIRHWGELWTKKYRTNNNFDEFIKKLNMCFYNTKDNFYSEQLNQELITLIKNRKTL